jgi:hypothetical protein
MSKTTVSKMIYMVHEVRKALSELENSYLRNRKKPNLMISCGLSSLRLDFSLIILSVPGELNTVTTQEFEKKYVEQKWEEVKDKCYLEFLCEEKDPKSLSEILVKLARVILIGEEGHKRLLGNSRLKEKEKEIIETIGPIWRSLYYTVNSIFDVLDKYSPKKGENEGKKFKENIIKVSESIDPGYLGAIQVNKGKKRKDL